MKYDAALRNPKPPGDIHSVGTFGPWVTEEPGDTPLSGNYVLDKADLSVFTGIVGILASKGQFKGSLSSVTARGQASVPDFGLKRSGNRVPLSTTFEVLVDGTNGNTLLKPVHATLGNSSFTTSGGVIKHDGDEHRTIGLDVKMPNGNLVDLLRLAMKGPPFMEGRIFLNTTVAIPPLLGKVREKLLLDGQFKVSEGKFRRSKIQDQIDALSRRGQGQPKNEEIDEVVSLMTGDFKLADEMITFHTLSFGVPGAAISLAGDYDLAADALDFHGALKLEAKVSQTMSGWKRWALRPVDPFFAKNGAGTFLRIKVVGTSREPKFGLDRGQSRRRPYKGEGNICSEVAILLKVLNDTELEGADQEALASVAHFIAAPNDKSIQHRHGKQALRLAHLKRFRGRTSKLHGNRHQRPIVRDIEQLGPPLRH